MPLIKNTMYMHHCISHFERASYQFSLDNGYLVTLRYCELSVTKFSVCVFVFIYLLYCLPYVAYTHALKSSFLCLLLYSLFHHLLFVGITHASLPVKIIHVRLMYSTQLPYAAERGPNLWLIHLCESVICFIYVTDTVYSMHFFFTYFPCFFTVISHRDHIAESLSQYTASCFCCFCLIKLGPSGLTQSFTECRCSYTWIHNVTSYCTCLV